MEYYCTSASVKSRKEKKIWTKKKRLSKMYNTKNFKSSNWSVKGFGAVHFATVPSSVLKFTGVVNLTITTKDYRSMKSHKPIELKSTPIKIPRMRSFFNKQNEFECNQCKATFIFFFQHFWPFLCLFGENDSLHFTH